MAGHRQQTARDDFLGAFDIALQPRILDFAAHLADLDADVLMFTARKAACLYDAMREVGLVRTHGVTSSDRVLDMDLGWLAGKRVAVVDDVVITGSTLYRTRQRLENAGASVSTHVLAVDRENWVEDLVTPSNSGIHLAAREALGLCTQIVNALSVVPRPYNLDWPLLEGAVIPDHDGVVLGGMPGWRTTDVSSSLQERKGVFSLTLDANPLTRRRFIGLVGPAAEPVSLEKVRVYGRRDAHSPRLLNLRALPIVAFDNADARTIDTMFRHVTTSIGIGDVADQFVTLTSKSRLIQFALSRELGELWLEDLGASTRLQRRGQLGHEQLLFAFPPTVAQRLLASQWAVWAGAPASPIRPRPPRAPVPALASIDEVQEALTEPFTDLYLNKEIRARAILKAEGRDAFTNPEHVELIDRLSTGYSPQDLSAIARGYSDADQVAEEIVSAFLDIAIDHGVIVPISEERDGAVRRSYRHGEDVEFSEVDFALFSIMLDAAAKAADVATLDRITIEKLCVIFLRIALQRGQLNRWWGRLGAPRTIGVRWYLHGARVQADTESIYGAANGTGLIDSLSKRGALTKEKKSGRMRIGRTTEANAPVSDAASNLAREVGYVFGQLLADEPKPILRVEDLILLASCPNQASTAGALAAEVFLVNQAWPTFRARRQVLLTEDQDVTGWARTTTVAKALRSGTWKYHNVRSRIIDRIIDRVSDDLAHPVTKTVWEGYWPEDVGRRRGEFPDLDRLVDDAGRWLLAARCYFLALCAADAQQRDAPYGHVMRLLKESQTYAELHHQFRIEGSSDAPTELVRTAWAAINGSTGLAHVGASADENLSRMMTASGSILDRTRAISRRLGEPRVLNSFSAAAYVVYRSDQASSASFERALLQHAGARRQATVGRPGARFDAASMGGLEDGQLYIAKGRRAAESMTEFARDIARSAPVEIGARVYLFPALEEEFQIHTGDVDGASYGDAFVERMTALLTLGDQYWPVPGPGVLLLASEPSLAVLKTSRASLVRTLSEHGQSLTSEIGIWNGWEGTRVTMAGQIAEGPRTVDCLVLTVIPDEYNAVRDWMREGDDFTENLVAGRYVSLATITQDGTAHTYACAQAQSQGSASLVNLIAFGSRSFKARVIALVGIGGAISDKVTLGDVVVASSIVDYGPQAITAEGPAHRGEAPPAHAAVSRAAQHLLAERGDPAKFPPSPQAIALCSTGFEIHYAPIGTGYAVVKHRDADVRTWLLDVNDKVLVLETEAAGIATVFYEQVSNEQHASFMVIRGVSDHADHDKDDSWKVAAAANAARVLGRLLPGTLAVVDSV